MIRVITVSGFIIGLIAAAITLPRWLGETSDAAVGRQTSACNLQHNDCEWQQQGQNWRVSLSDITTSDHARNNYRLDIVAPGAPQRLLVVLRGESMYMGEYPVPLVRTGSGYHAEFVAPFCTTGEAMLWRVDLQQGMEPMDEQPPFKLVFQAG